MVLIKLFEISNTESKESIRLRSFSAKAAPEFPLLAIARSRWRLEESMLVSAIEKKPESASKNKTKAA
jgi:hypothetical protein